MANVAERAGPLDCPECGAAGAVRRGLCDVCYAEIDDRAAALPPAAGRPEAPPS